MSSLTAAVGEMEIGMEMRPTVDVLDMPDGTRRVFHLVLDGKGGLNVPEDQKQEYQKGLNAVVESKDRSPKPNATSGSRKPLVGCLFPPKADAETIAKRREMNREMHKQIPEKFRL